MRIRISNGKYEFVKDNLTIKILRGGQPWHEQSEAFNAITSMMAELDAARVVVTAAREIFRGVPGSQGTIARALKQHDALVDDIEPPSEWAAP